MMTVSITEFLPKCQALDEAFLCAENHFILTILWGGLPLYRWGNHITERERKVWQKQWLGSRLLVSWAGEAWGGAALEWAWNKGGKAAELGEEAVCRELGERAGRSRLALLQTARDGVQQSGPEDGRGRAGLDMGAMVSWQPRRGTRKFCDYSEGLKDRTPVLTLTALQLKSETGVRGPGAMGNNQRFGFRKQILKAPS